jgi:RNA polymerase sigma-70 factor (ECF subfamily)
MSEGVFLELVQQYQACVYRHALYLLNDQDDAKDVTQETFIKAWKHAAELRAETMRSWLLKCANNLSIDLLRRRKFQAPLTEGDDEELEALIHSRKEAGEFQSSHPSPEELCIKREQQQLVKHAISQLPLHFRTVVIITTLSISGWS